MAGWKQYKQELNQQYQEMQIPEDVFERSVACGNQVAHHVLAYSN